MLRPADLLGLAARRHLAAIAITDHDTVSGLDEALASSQSTGVELLTGVEISSQLGDSSMHILGYGFDHRRPEFLAFLKILQENRRLRNLGILDRLNALGIEIDIDELEQSAGNQAGRPHIARLLVKKKLVGTVQEAFVRYLKLGGLAFVEQRKPESAEAIARIREAGGLSFLAHPSCTDPSLEKIPSLVKQLSEQGLNGIETFYPTHSTKACRILEKIAADHHLLLSGGTDFHGDSNASTPLGGHTAGMRVPLQVLVKIKEKLSCLHAGSLARK